MGKKKEIRTTEQSSNYTNLEKMSTLELMRSMNREDDSVPKTIRRILPSIVQLSDAVYEKMRSGGRLFYIGAGTSGRLGIVDASECPPTFGVEHGRVIGIMAGGDKAMRKAVEFAEDDEHQAFKDLKKHKINTNDFVVGIAASGSTPYVWGGLKDAQEKGITTGCIVCNAGSKVASFADFPVEAVVGPEFVTGSTRMKSGTAQKLILNMLSTSVMIKLGHIKGNKMVDMQLSNHKLIGRGTRMIMEELAVTEKKAEKLLLEHGSVRKAIEAVRKK